MVNTKIGKKVGLDPKKVELYQYVFSNGTSEELCFLMAVFMLDGLLPGVKIRPSWLNGNVPVSKGYQDMLVDFNGAKNAGLLQPGEGTKFFQQTGGTLKHLVTNLQFNSTCTVLVSIFYDMFLRKPTEKAVKWQLKVMGIKPFHASPARLEALRKDFLDDLALKDEGNFFSI